MTRAKRAALGVCDFCGGSIHPDEWYTNKGRPRLCCCVTCRNTINSRVGAPIRSEKAKERVADGTWQSPAEIRPPTSEEQAHRARFGLDPTTPLIAPQVHAVCARAAQRPRRKK